MEFLGFIWHSGRPSSLIILTATYLVVVAFFYLKFRNSPMAEIVLDPEVAAAAGGGEPHIKNKRFTWVVCSAFVLTIIAMSLREVFGVLLGFIAFSGALALVLVFEIFGRTWRLDPPSLEEMLGGARLEGDRILRRPVRPGGRAGEHPRPRDNRELAGSLHRVQPAARGQHPLLGGPPRWWAWSSTMPSFSPCST